MSYEKAKKNGKSFTLVVPLVAAVIMTILNAQGIELESGLAVEMLSKGCWIYKVTAPVPGWEKGRIVVRVTDSPGNTVKSVQAVKDAIPPG